MARTFYFSPSEMGFFDPVLFDAMPADVVEIDEGTYRELIGSGKSIVLDRNGRPIVAAEPPLSLEDQSERERVWRDELLLQYGGIRDRHRDEVELGIATTVTAVQYAELLTCLQALRDWPQSELFPNSAQRPAPPAWLIELTQ